MGRWERKSDVLVKTQVLELPVVEFSTSVCMYADDSRACDLHGVGCDLNRELDFFECSKCADRVFLRHGHEYRPEFGLLVNFDCHRCN